MAVVQLSDVIVPSAFTSYIVENSMVKNALVQAGVMAKNGVILD